MPEKKKMGRPPLDNPRKKSLNVRLTDEEAQLLQDCATLLKKTRTDVIVQGVKELYERERATK